MRRLLQVTKDVKQLVNDMKQVMEPYTASKLKVLTKSLLPCRASRCSDRCAQARRSNVLKDFVMVAGPLGVSHMVHSQLCAKLQKQ